MDINKEIANKVRQAMENKNESIANTSKLSTIPYATLYRRLHDGGDFTMTELGKLADALEVHPSELMPDAFAQESAA